MALLFYFMWVGMPAIYDRNFKPKFFTDIILLARKENPPV